MQQRVGGGACWEKEREPWLGVFSCWSAAQTTGCLGISRCLVSPHATIFTVPVLYRVPGRRRTIVTPPKEHVPKPSVHVLPVCHSIHYAISQSAQTHRHYHVCQPMPRLFCSAHQPIKFMKQPNVKCLCAPSISTPCLLKCHERAQQQCHHITCHCFSARHVCAPPVLFKMPTAGVEEELLELGTMCWSKKHICLKELACAWQKKKKRQRGERRWRGWMGLFKNKKKPGALVSGCCCWFRPQGSTPCTHHTVSHPAAVRPCHIFMSSAKRGVQRIEHAVSPSVRPSVRTLPGFKVITRRRNIPKKPTNAKRPVLNFPRMQVTFVRKKQDKAE